MADVRGALWVFVSLAGVAAGLTLTFLGMRSVMEIGGACGSGGPFVPVRPCPENVPGLMMAGIWGGLVCAGVYAFQAFRRKIPNFTSLLWPALFLSLGWNFLEYGLDPPQSEEVAWGWLVCAVVFGLMGGVPLLLGATVVLGRKRLGPAAGIRVAQGMAKLGATRVATAGEDDLVAQLERLDRLNRSGALTDEEYMARRHGSSEGTPDNVRARLLARAPARRRRSGDLGRRLALRLAYLSKVAVVILGP